MTSLYDVTVQHPDGGTRAFRISGTSADTARAACETVGMNVIEVVPIRDGIEDAPEPSEGRLYGEPSKGKRRTKDEMEQDAAIEATAEELGIDLGEWEGRDADTIEAQLKAQIASAEAAK